MRGTPFALPRITHHASRPRPPRKRHPLCLLGDLRRDPEHDECIDGVEGGDGARVRVREWVLETVEEEDRDREDNRQDRDSSDQRKDDEQDR